MSKLGEYNLEDPMTNSTYEKYKTYEDISTMGEKIDEITLDVWASGESKYLKAWLTQTLLAKAKERVNKRINEMEFTTPNNFFLSHKIGEEIIKGLEEIIEELTK